MEAIQILLTFAGVAFLGLAAWRLMCFRVSQSAEDYRWMEIYCWTFMSLSAGGMLCHALTPQGSVRNPELLRLAAVAAFALICFRLRRNQAAYIAVFGKSPGGALLTSAMGPPLRSQRSAATLEPTQPPASFEAVVAECETEQLLAVQAKLAREFSKPVSIYLSWLMTITFHTCGWNAPVSKLLIKCWKNYYRRRGDCLRTDLAGFIWRCCSGEKKIFAVALLQALPAHPDFPLEQLLPLSGTDDSSASPDAYHAFRYKAACVSLFGASGLRLSRANEFAEDLRRALVAK